MTDSHGQGDGSDPDGSDRDGSDPDGSDPDGAGVRQVARAAFPLPDGLEVTPAADPAQLAAILAAHEVLWPEPAPAVGPPPVGAWRFSGRWWSGIGPRAAMPRRLR